MIQFFIVYLDVIFICSPIIIYIVSYLLLKIILKQKWKVIHITSQLTAPFLVIATSYLVNYVYRISIFYYSIIFFLVIVMIHLIIQWKKDTEVVLKKALKLALRVTFLLFFIFYIIFGILSLIHL